MPTALRVPGLVRQPVLVAQVVVRRRARAQWYPLRLESRVASLLDSLPELRLVRKTALLAHPLLEQPAVVPESPSEPVVRRERSVVALARSRLLPAWLLALPAHPLLQAAWHCPVLQERSVAVRRTRELQRACSQPESAWKHLPAPV
jgi:hypothetical protein